MSVDNMSVRLLQRRMPVEVADEIKDNLGKYLNAQYKQFEMSGPLQKYKPTAEQINNATELLKANKIKGYQELNKPAPSIEFIEKFCKDAPDDDNQF